MKKFLAVLLAVAIVLTGIVPANIANAATTTVQNDGLNMDTDKYGPYMTDGPLSQLPATIEATIRLPQSTSTYRAGIIVGNGRYEASTTGETGVFNFGFFKGMIPYLYVADSGHKSGHFYLFGEYTGSGNLTTDYTVAAEETNRMRATFCTGEWTHIALVNDVASNEMCLYVNGELFHKLEDTCYSDAFTMSQDLWLGGDRRGSGNSQRLRGDIKDLAMYADARSATEVQSDYTNGVTGSEQGLIGAYKMALKANGAYPRTLTDLSGNGNDFKLPWITEEEKEAYAPRQAYDYSMAVIGDQQIVTANTANNNNGKVDQVFQWVIDQVDARKIKFAFNLGDITDNNSEAQWEAGLPALQQLDGVLPYSIVRGNHDYVEQYKEKVTYEHYKSQIAGTFDGTMLNTYQKFQVENIKYLVVNLDFGVGGDDTSDSDEIIAWANDVIRANPEYNVIITTHAYLDADGTRLEPGDSGAASREKTGYYREKDGVDIWNELASQHSNVVLVLSGHIGTEKIVKRESTGVHGNKVVEMLVNPQTTDQYLGPAGIVSMFYFSNGGKTVQVEYYSILRDLYYKEESQFTFNLNVIESPKEVVLENGTVLLEKAAVNTSGNIPVANGADYKDYVFAGWYKSANADYDNVVTDLSQVNENCYAKFIPKEILNVKAQVSNGVMASGAHAGKYAIRFISSVESLDYKSVGFKVTYTDANGQSQTKTVSSNTVYERIKSNIDEVDYNYSPSAMTIDSEYFITAKLPVINSEVEKNRCYTVQAFVETADGTKVYGPSRTISVNDAKETILNTTVDAVLDAQKTYVAVCTNGTMGAIQVLRTEAGESNVRITFTQSVADVLPSLSDVTVKEVLGTDNYKNVVTFKYRNFYTTHKSGDAASPNNDTTWYTYDPMAKVFVVASSADLFGFAKLIDSNTTNFIGREVRLVCDVVVNKGVAVPSTATADAKWVADAGELVYEWDPIGKDWAASSNYFEGTFDGDGNSVSGIWLDNTTNYNGFFATAGPNSIIKNFAVVNSYFKAAHDYLGSIVAFSRSQYLENLYSDAILVLKSTSSTTRSCAGGIVGRYGNPDAATNTNLRSTRKCWFDGQINAYGTVTRIGGISGDLLQAMNVEFLDCLYTGEIKYEFTGAASTSVASYPSVGGMYGYVENALNTRSHTFKNCLSAGKITVTYPSGVTHAAGTFIGRTSVKSGGTTIANCYATCELTVNGTASTINAGSVHRDHNWNVDCTKAKNDLLISSDSVLETWFPKLSGNQENPWMCYVNESGTALGNPILKMFADCWLEKQ